MIDWEAITPALKGKLNPANVKPAPKGKYGEYVEGWFVIAEANAIFGFGAWSYRIDHLDEAARDLVWLEGKDGKYQQWRVCHVCQVTVTVGDVSRQDIGTGQGQAKPASLGDAIDSSAKEAVTDALKRALRSFGNRFGLALYDKTKAGVGVDEPDHEEPKAVVRQVPAEPTTPLSQQASAQGPRQDGLVLTKAAGEAILAAIAACKNKAALSGYMDALGKGPNASAANHPKIKVAAAERYSELDLIAYGEVQAPPTDNPFAEAG